LKDSKPAKDVFTAALDSLSRSNLSEFELTSRLKRKDYISDEISEAVEKLKGYGYLDDRKVVESLLRKAERDCRGPQWLDAHLYKKGISQVLRDEGRDKLLELSDGLALEALEIRVKKIEGDLQEEKARLYRFLAGRGFLPESIRRAFDTIEKQRCNDEHQQ
tara:strand:+ start:257 stop:742 length:486 start_codon:yes stop_codon:yes gene_type:complete